MKTLSEVASSLRSQTATRGLTQDVLRQRAGVSRRTLTHVLSGQQDYKVTTLLAVADKLGLELVLVPREAAVGLGHDDTAAAAPMSAIQRAQAEVAARLSAHATGRRKKQE